MDKNDYLNHHLFPFGAFFILPWLESWLHLVTVSIDYSIDPSHYSLLCFLY